MNGEDFLPYLGYIIAIVGIIFSFFIGRFEKNWEYERIKKSLRDQKFLDGQLEFYRMSFDILGRMIVGLKEIQTIAKSKSKNNIEIDEDLEKELIKKVLEIGELAIEFKKAIIISKIYTELETQNKIDRVAIKVVEALSVFKKEISIEDIVRFDDKCSEIENLINNLALGFRKSMGFMN